MSSTWPDNAATPRQSFHLGGWLVDPAGDRLCKDGETRHLEPKVMDVLVELADNHRQVVNKAQLLDRVWAGRFVVEGVLKRCISELRKALDDDPKAPRFIETVPKRGYRLISTLDTAEQVIADNGKALLKFTPGHSPFRGLRAFDPEHAPIFFGREGMIVEVTDALDKQTEQGRSFVLVVGPSGSGKSSLVRAGVIPRLATRSATGLPYAIFEHGTHAGNLFDGLLHSLADVTALNLRLDDAERRYLTNTFRDDSAAAVEWISGRVHSSTAGGNSLVLVIDQMEQIFRFESVSDDECTDFIGLVHTLARSGLVRVIATLRSDFYPAFSYYPALLSLKRPYGQVEMQPLSSADIGKVIRLPARMARLRFEQIDDSFGLDDLLQDASIQQPHYLPLLEFTLDELYKRRTSEGLLSYMAYQDLGGLEGCVAKRAEEVFNNLSQAARAALPLVLALLVAVTPGTDENVSRSSLLYSRLSRNSEAKELIDGFVAARLFSSSLAADGKDRIVQVAHEALLSHWPRAKTWADKYRSLLHTKTWLGTQLTRWQSEGRATDYLLPDGKPLIEAEQLLSSGLEPAQEEQQFIAASRNKANRRARIKQALVGSLAVLALVALVAALFANQQRLAAEAETEKATAVADFLGSVFEASDPGRTGGDAVSARTLLDRGARRIDLELQDQPEVQAALKFAMADVYHSLGALEQAIGLLEDTRAIRVRLFGDSHPQVTAAETRLGEVLIDVGRLDEAERLLRRAIITQRLTADSGSPHLARSLHNLGTVLMDTDRLPEAEKSLTEALQIRRTAFGDNHIEVADSLNNLAAVDYQQKEFGRAEAGYLEAIRIYESHGDYGLAELARTLNNLGNLRHDRHDLTGAEGHYRRAIQIREALYGPDHHDLAALLSNLGSLQYDLDRFDDATNTLRRAHRIAETHLGSDHVHTAINAVKYGEVILRTGSLETLPDLAQSIATLQEAFGADSWVAARARSVLGESIIRSGDFRAAEVILMESYETLRSDESVPANYAKDALRRLQKLYIAWKQTEKLARLQKRPLAQK